MTQKRTSALRRTLERILPPNVPADTMQGIIIGSLAIGALTAAIDFTVHYAATYRGMFYWDGRLMDTALMGPFSAYVEPVVIVFGVVVLLALLWKRVRSKLTTTKTNVDSVIGAEGYVTEAIDNLSYTGRVKLGGFTWAARSTSGAGIPVGTLVKVERIEGVKVFVSPAEVACKQ